MVNRVGQQLGNYKLEALLGVGGFAEVYLAEHIALKQKRAIKVLHTILSEQERVSFRTEAQRLARLDHPHIISIFDFDEREEFPYLVMEYAPNGSLRKQHPKGSRVPLPTIVDYINQIASALQYIHDQKLIHCDVKPENMLLSLDNKILLSDIGIAAVAHSEHSQQTQTQSATGTPYYMAPEQWGRKPMSATDQYALGIMVYEWLCGEYPFGGNSFQLMYQHLNEAPPSLRDKVPTIPPRVEQVVRKALAKEPKRRFMSVQDFADKLKEASQTKSRMQPIPQPQPTIPPTQKAIQPQVAITPTKEEEPLLGALYMKSVCPMCMKEFYPGDCEIVSGFQPDKVLKYPPTGLRRHMERINPEPLTGREYIKAIACRKCPHCGYLLPPNFERANNINIVVVGDTSSGKSHYLASCIHQLRQSSASQIIGCSAIMPYRNTDSNYFNTYYPLYRDKRALSPTKPDQHTEPLIYELLFQEKSTLQQKRKVNLLFYDTSGEHIAENKLTTAYAQYIQYASAIIFLADPLSMPGLVQYLPDVLKPKPSEQRVLRPDYVLNRVAYTLQHYQKEQFQKVKIPIAITISKSDLLDFAERTSNPPLYLTDSYLANHLNVATFNVINAQVQDFLHSKGDRNLIRSSDVFENVSFFAVSATGWPQDNTGTYPSIEPRRCLEPLLWILWKLGITSEDK